MSLNRHAKRRDDNERDVIDALHKAGFYVEQTDNFDLLVAAKGQWFRFEVKDGKKPPSKCQLTENEQNLLDKINNRAPVYIVKSAEEALKVIGGN